MAMDMPNLSDAVASSADSLDRARLGALVWREEDEPAVQTACAANAMASDPANADDAPIVVLDRDEDLAALPAATPQVTLGLDGAAQQYLREQGLPDPSTWDAYRLGQVDAAIYERLGLVGRRLPRGGGVSIPTCDPRQPDQIVGVVRLTPAQNKHTFASAPAGLACPIDIDNRSRVVLVDAPLLALRLHQAGVHDVALVEDPAVLAPLADWLVRREVLLASYTAAGLNRLAGAMPAALIQVQRVLMSMSPDRTSDGVRALLGMQPKAKAAPPPITSLLLRDLHAYAEGRLQTSEGLAALRQLGLDDADLLRAYRLGYFPVDFREALTIDQRRAIAGILMGDAIVVPAFDDNGAVVDLMTLRSHTSGHLVGTVWAEPRGLIAPVLARAYDRLLVTDTLRRVGRLWRTGQPTLLVRGAADATRNAARLAASGVRQIEVRAFRHGDAIAAAFTGAGISASVAGNETATQGAIVPFPTPADPPIATISSDQAAPTEPTEPAAPPPAVAPASAAAIDLIRHDAAIEQAVFRCGDATLTCQIPWGETTNLEVVLQRGEQRHRDRLDLAVVAQRLRFASCASLRTGLTPAVIADALVALLPAVQALAKPAVPAVVTPDQLPPMPAADRDAATALLRADDLLDRIANDLEHLGWIGESDAKALVVLAATSRLCPEPVWAVLTATTAGERFPALRALTAITPPEHLVHVSRLTDNALFHADPSGLKHKLLILDDAEAVSPAVATALRILHARGALTGTQVERDAIRGEMRTRFIEAGGPLAVVTATTGQVHQVLRHHLIEIPVDETVEQAERILAARRRVLAVPIAGSPAERIAARLRNAQRLLLPRPVLIPAAEQVAVPTPILRNRSLQDAFFSLIAASACLHQYQRLLADGHVVATQCDLAIATRLVTALAGQRVAGLSSQAQHLLNALWAARRTSFTMEDLTALLPDWSRWAFRASLAELARLDYVAAGRSGRGKLRDYTLVATSATAAATAYDQPGRELGELAAVGGGQSANPSREVVNG